MAVGAVSTSRLVRADVARFLLSQKRVRCLARVIRDGIIIASDDKVASLQREKTPPFLMLNFILDVWKFIYIHIRMNIMLSLIHIYGLKQKINLINKALQNRVSNGTHLIQHHRSSFSRNHLALWLGSFR